MGGYKVNIEDNLKAFPKGKAKTIWTVKYLLDYNSKYKTYMFTVI